MSTSAKIKKKIYVRLKSRSRTLIQNRLIIIQKNRILLVILLYIGDMCTPEIF